MFENHSTYTPLARVHVTRTELFTRLGMLRTCCDSPKPVWTAHSVMYVIYTTDTLVWGGGAGHRHDVESCICDSDADSLLCCWMSHVRHTTRCRDEVPRRCPPGEWWQGKLKQTFSRIFCRTAAGIQSAVCKLNRTSALVLTVRDRRGEESQGNDEFFYELLVNMQISTRSQWDGNLYWHADHLDHCFCSKILSDGLERRKKTDYFLNYFLINFLDILILPNGCVSFTNWDVHWLILKKQQQQKNRRW